MQRPAQMAVLIKAPLNKSPGIDASVSHSLQEAIPLPDLTDKLSFGCPLIFHIFCHPAVDPPEPDLAYHTKKAKNPDSIEQ